MVVRRRVGEGHVSPGDGSLGSPGAVAALECLGAACSEVEYTQRAAFPLSTGCRGTLPSRGGYVHLLLHVVDTSDIGARRAGM
jgi:hypothetical protein